MMVIILLKGIKAANEVNIYNGTIYIKTYDDAIHANNGENGINALGNININGGKILFIQMMMEYMQMEF